MPLPDITELIWRDLNQRISAVNNRVSSLTNRSEQAQVAGGLAGLTLAQLPLTNNTPGDLYYAIDGLKPGEAVGHGTGCAVYWDGSTNSWLRVGDYSSPSGGGGPILGVVQGGTGANLGATGGANQYVKQLSAGGVFSVGIIADADLPTAMAGKTLTTATLTQPAIGDFTLASHDHHNAINGGQLAANIVFTGPGTVPLGFGGTGVNLSATGGLNQFVKQNSAGGVFSVGTIASADIATALTTPGPVGNSAANTGSFTTLTASLGAAVGSAINTAVALIVSGQLMVGTTQYGIYDAPVFSSADTATGYGLFVAPSTQAAAFTLTNAIGVNIVDVAKGAGSTVTNAYGIFIGNIAAGATLNYAIFTGTGKVSFGDVFLPVQKATASAPPYIKGGMYFDTTLNKLRIGGATAWETVTSA